MSSQVLNLFPVDYPFETLVARANATPPKLILNPEFQRKYKWDKDGFGRASRFIESCLMRIPLPACYFAETDNGSHDVIDGVQRITTIKKFLNNEFKLEGLTVFKDLEGKSFAELGDYQTDLETTTIRCVILRKENPKNLIQEIFARLNQGAVSLTAQEIRHAVYPGTLDELLSELAPNEIIARFGMGESGSKVKDGREDEEMVMRYFALQTDLSDYNDKLSEYLDVYMRDNQNLDSRAIDVLKQSFNSTLEKAVAVFDNNLFVDVTKSKKRQSLVYYDLIMWSFKDLSMEFLTTHKDEIKAKFNEMCNDKVFVKTLSGGTQLKGSIIKRRVIWSKLISEVHD